MVSNYSSDYDGDLIISRVSWLVTSTTLAIFMFP